MLRIHLEPVTKHQKPLCSRAADVLQTFQDSAFVTWLPDTGRDHTWANSAMLPTLCHKLLFVAQIKQEIEINTEEQELRITINLLTSDPNRKQSIALSLPTTCIYKLVHRRKHFTFPFKKHTLLVWEIRSRQDINISLITQTEGIQMPGLGDNTRQHLHKTK